MKPHLSTQVIKHTGSGGREESNVALVIELGDLIEACTPDVKRELAKHLMWDEETLEDVLFEIVHSRTSGPGWNDVIHNLRMAFIVHCPEIVRNMIVGIIHQWELEKREAKYWVGCYQSGNSDLVDRTPYPELPTDEQVDKLIEYWHTLQADGK